MSALLVVLALWAVSLALVCSAVRAASKRAALIERALELDRQGRAERKVARARRHRLIQLQDFAAPEREAILGAILGDDHE